MKNNKISMSQLAKICGVSQGTVDRALHNRVGINKETRDHILTMAKKYGYRPNGTLNTDKKSGMVGIIVFDLYNEYFSELIVEIERKLRSRGYYSIVMFSDKNPKVEKECVEALYNAGADAIIICPVNEGAEFSEYLRSWKIPIVTFGNKVENIKYVGIDNFNAMQELTQYIISKNKKELIYYSPALKTNGPNLYAQIERFEGFKSVVNKYSLKLNVLYDEDTLKKTVNENSMVIASTDYYALKLVFSGIVRAENISGFDNIGTIEKFNLKIVSVSCDKEKIASVIFDYITNGGDDNDSFTPYEISNK